MSRRAWLVHKYPETVTMIPGDQEEDGFPVAVGLDRGAAGSDTSCDKIRIKYASDVTFDWCVCASANSDRSVWILATDYSFFWVQSKVRWMTDSTCLMASLGSHHVEFAVWETIICSPDTKFLGLRSHLLYNEWQ